MSRSERPIESSHPRTRGADASGAGKYLPVTRKVTVVEAAAE